MVYTEKMRPRIAEDRKLESNLDQTFCKIISYKEGRRVLFDSRNQERMEDPEFDGWRTTGQFLLDGHSCEILSIKGGNCHLHDCLNYIENDDLLIGIAQLPVTAANLEEQSERMYRAVIEITGSRYLYRVWNYIPRINEEEPGMIENYKLFCCGRAKALAKFYRDGNSMHFPAASATGCEGSHLTVVFLAGLLKPAHWENPEQLPAYEYPKKYGPRSPSFARASRFTDAEGGEWISVAGTAAIKGSETLFPGDFGRQLPIALENIDLVLRQVGMDLSAKKSRRRHFKFFLRNSKNLSALQSVLRDTLGPVDTYAIVKSDICRADLEVEIELTIYPDG